MLNIGIISAQLKIMDAFCFSICNFSVQLFHIKVYIYLLFHDGFSSYGKNQKGILKDNLGKKNPKP